MCSVFCVLYQCNIIHLMLPILVFVFLKSSIDRIQKHLKIATNVIPFANQSVLKYFLCNAFITEKEIVTEISNEFEKPWK